MRQLNRNSMRQIRPHVTQKAARNNTTHPKRHTNIPDIRQRIRICPATPHTSCLQYSWRHTRYTHNLRRVRKQRHNKELQRLERKTSLIGEFCNEDGQFGSQLRGENVVVD